MKTVRSKFQVVSVKEFAHGSKQAELTTRYSNTPEDNQFAKATPNGNITITVDNPDTKDFLVPGKDYFVDFTPADS
jgi:hypothetical protein